MSNLQSEESSAAFDVDRARQGAAVDERAPVVEIQDVPRAQESEGLAHGGVLHLVVRRRAQRKLAQLNDLHLFQHCNHLSEVNGAPLARRWDGEPTGPSRGNTMIMARLAQRHAQGRFIYMGLLLNHDNIEFFGGMLSYGYDTLAMRDNLSPSIFNLDHIRTYRFV